MVQERNFRAALFYRLRVFPIALPPLRERTDDIPLLVRHFLRQFAERMNKGVHIVPDEVMEVLKLYHWPGNIRELQNFIERAVILSSGPVLSAPLGDLKPDFGQSADSHKPAYSRTVADAERAHILDVLRQVDCVVGGHRGATVRFGLPRTTLMHRMRKLGVSLEGTRKNQCSA